MRASSMSRLRHANDPAQRSAAPLAQQRILMRFQSTLIHAFTLITLLIFTKQVMLRKHGDIKQKPQPEPITSPWSHLKQGSSRAAEGITFKGIVARPLGKPQ